MTPLSIPPPRASTSTVSLASSSYASSAPTMLSLQRVSSSSSISSMGSTSSTASSALFPPDNECPTKRGAWVFGYGSLIYKPAPFKLESKVGFIRGFARRFAQLSHDHRGTSSAPGMVVTLIPKDEWAENYAADDPPEADTVWGTMYHIPADMAEEVWEYLDRRETAYSLKKVDVYGVCPKTGDEIVLQHNCRVYVGETTNNPSFAGGLPMSTLAKQIATSAGVSGQNRDYLYNLSKAIRHMCPESEDQYLEALERGVRHEVNVLETSPQ